MGYKKTKWMILPALLLIGGVCALEVSASESGNVRAESHTSRLDGWNGCKKIGGDSFLPMSDGRENAMKTGENGGAECGAGISPSHLVTVAPRNVPAKADGKDRAKNGVDVGEEGFNHWWWLLTIAVALMPIFTRQET